MANGSCTDCIVYAPAGGTIDERLRTLPEARRWRLTAYADSCTAMAELCLREKAQASRAAWGLRRAERPSLLLALSEGDVDANLEGELAGLVAAVQRYLPGVPIWLYAEENLSLIADGERTEDQPYREGAAPTPPPAAPKPAAPRSVPAELRLADAPEETPDPPTVELDDEPDAAMDDDARITAEELDMLFARDTDEAPAP